MAQKVVIELDVRDGELGDLNKELQKTEASFRDVEKAADKTSASVDDVAGNGGAIAILDSLTGGLATRMRDAFEATKLFNISLKGTRTALIATGIGAFVVALGLVIANWKEIDNWIRGVNRRLEKTVELTEHRLNLLDQEQSILQKQMEINELLGKSNEQLIAQEEELLQKKKENLLVLLDTLRAQLAIEQSREGELTFIEKAKAGLVTLFGSPEQIADTVTDALGINLISDLVGKIKEVEASLLDVEIASLRLQGGTGGQAGGGPTPQVEGVGDLTPEGALQVLQDKALKDALLENARASNEELFNMEVERLQNELAVSKLVQEQKLALTQDTLGKMTQILGENTVAGKAAGAALALINAYQGVTEIWANKTTLPEPFGTINKIASTAIALKSALSAVRKINSVKIPQFRGASGGGGGGGISVPQPSFNIVGNTGVNQIANVLDDRLQEPVKAFVVARDVTSAQELERAAIQGSSI